MWNYQRVSFFNPFGMFRVLGIVMATNHVKWIGNATVVFNLSGATNVFARIDMITSIAQGYQAKHQMIAWLESTCALFKFLRLCYFTKAKHWMHKRKGKWKRCRETQGIYIYTHNYNRKCTSNHWHPIFSQANASQFYVTKSLKTTSWAVFKARNVVPLCQVKNVVPNSWVSYDF